MRLPCPWQTAINLMLTFAGIGCQGVPREAAIWRSSQEACDIGRPVRNVDEKEGAAAHPQFMDSASSQPVGDLFHPVPKSALGPMVTDRPGQTNGPFTVAPGHLQIETGILNYTYDHGSRLNRADVFSQSDFRVGLAPDAEIDVVLNPFSWQRQAGASTSGFGDTTLQGKWTALSDNSKNVAFGLIPFITLPTSQHGLGSGGTQGGIFFPLALSLPADFGLGFMPGAYAAHNATGGYHTEVVASVAISHPVVGTLSAFGEFAANIDAQHPSDWIGSIDFGLVYLITPDLQLDVAMNVGVTHAAPDFTTALGFSTRF